MRLLETYYQWTLHLLRPYLGSRLLDAGCGVGNFTSLIAGTAEYVLAADLSPRNVASLKERLRAMPHVEMYQIDLQQSLEELYDRRFDTVICLDVMEHLEDDVQLLRNFLQVIQPGGHLLVKVPACRWLFGTIDLASGHHRRYTTRELIRKARQAGWEPVKAHYMNLFGVLPYWCKSRFLKPSTTFSRTFRPWQLRLIRSLVPVFERFEQLVIPPVGQSAILVARRPTPATLHSRRRQPRRYGRRLLPAEDG